MIKEIIKTESGYDIVLDDKNKLHLDVVYMHDIEGYNEYEVIGTDAEGNLVRIDTRTMDKEYYNRYRYEGKRHEIVLCGELCWHVCQYKESEPMYDVVFDYLKECPEFDLIPDLATYLIEQCIKTQPSEEVAYKLYRVLVMKDYSHAYLDDDDLGHLNERFDIILELAKIITNQF